LRLDQDVVANHTAVLTSRTLNEMRFQFGRRSIWWDTDPWSGASQRPAGGFDPNIPFPHGPAQISRPSGTFGKASNMPQGRDENRYQFVNNLSYSRGSHDFKTGVDISIIRVDDLAPHNYDGTFNFATDLPFDPNNLATYPIQYTQAIFDPWTDLPDDLYAVFVQDTWRVRPNFTLNMGVRYDREMGFAQIIGTPDDKNNFSPRVGFVWDPFKTDRTAIRGGYGIYVDQTFTNIQLNVALSRKSKEITIVNPGYPDPFSRGTASQELPSITTASEAMQIPETRNFTLGVKREIVAGLAASADYVNARGYNQFFTLDVNYPDPLTGRRPNPNFLRIRQYTSEGHSWYNALLLGLERRSGRGPAFGVSYTLAENLRDVEAFGFTPQDGRNLAAEKGRADNDRRHQFVTHFTWMLRGGVQVAGLFQARSGVPWNVTTGIDNNRDTVINDRPDLAVPGGDPLDKNTYVSPVGRVGNLARNANNGPSFYSLDARISKLVQVQRMRVEAFVEGFNLTNKVNFLRPNGNLRSALFGKSTGIEGNQRQLEIGLRLDF
jgi:hypothetical protein